jgi:hypothetical protein
MAQLTVDKTADLAGPGISEVERILPNDYYSLLSPKETQIAVAAIKRYIDRSGDKPFGHNWRNYEFQRIGRGRFDRGVEKAAGPDDCVGLRKEADDARSPLPLDRSSDHRL